MTDDEVKCCFYTHTGAQRIVRSGCNNDVEWIPQDDMKFCPFCGNTLKVLRVATNIQIPEAQE